MNIALTLAAVFLWAAPGAFMCLDATGDWMSDRIGSDEVAMRFACAVVFPIAASLFLLRGIYLLAANYYRSFTA